MKGVDRFIIQGPNNDGYLWLWVNRTLADQLLVHYQGRKVWVKEIVRDCTLIAMGKTGQINFEKYCGLPFTNAELEEVGVKIAEALKENIGIMGKEIALTMIDSFICLIGIIDKDIKSNDHVQNSAIDIKGLLIEKIRRQTLQIVDESLGLEFEEYLRRKIKASIKKIINEELLKL